jgi:hypothetical protein
MKKTLFLTLFALVATAGFSQTEFKIQKHEYNTIQENEKFGIVEIVYEIINGNEVEKEKRKILPCEYSDIGFYSKVAIVAKGGTKKGGALLNAKWAMYNFSEEKFTTPFKYDAIEMFGEDLAACNVGGEHIDVSKSKYHVLEYHFSGGLWGYIDCQSGNEIIAPQYENVDAFGNGVAMVSKDGVTTLLQNPLLASDVDINIPVTNVKNEETFAFVFANQDYTKFSVPFAINDGKLFKEYCAKTFGIPKNNIQFYENATFGNMISAINKIKDYADAYDGDARFIVYYSGQGVSDENSKIPYLLPVDAVLNNLSATAYSMEKLNRELSELSAKSIWLIIDACFNGADKEGKMLASGRGVAVKPNPNRADGNLILFSATSGNETAYAYKEKNHGLFTYYLLKKLQETNGDITSKALTDYVTVEVKKQSVGNTSVQSPTVIVSEKLINWQTLKLK